MLKCFFLILCLVLFFSLFQAEQLSYTQLLDYLVILVMAAIWFVMPSDGIAVVTQWFSNKIMDVCNLDDISEFSFSIEKMLIFRNISFECISC